MRYKHYKEITYASGLGKKNRAYLAEALDYQPQVASKHEALVVTEMGVCGIGDCIGLISHDPDTQSVYFHHMNSVFKVMIVRELILFAIKTNTIPLDKLSEMRLLRNKLSEEDVELAIKKISSLNLINKFSFNIITNSAPESKIEDLLALLKACGVPDENIYMDIGPSQMLVDRSTGKLCKDFSLREAQISKEYLESDAAKEEERLVLQKRMRVSEHFKTYINQVLVQGDEWGISLDSKTMNELEFVASSLLSIQNLSPKIKLFLGSIASTYLPCYLEPLQQALIKREMPEGFEIIFCSQNFNEVKDFLVATIKKTNEKSSLEDMVQAINADRILRKSLKEFAVQTRMMVTYACPPDQQPFLYQLYFEKKFTAISTMTYQDKREAALRGLFLEFIEKSKTLQDPNAERWKEFTKSFYKSYLTALKIDSPLNSTEESSSQIIIHLLTASHNPNKIDNMPAPFAIKNNANNKLCDS